MSNCCEVIDQAALGAVDSMNIDAQWIENLQTFQYPRVRFYDWSCKSITYGNFTHFCMATATKYDLIYAGKKLGGSAQRKTAGGFVHQGTLFLSPPDWNEIAAILQFPKESIDVMKASCVALLPHGASKEEVSVLRQSMKIAFTEAFNKSLRDACGVAAHPQLR